MAKYLHAEDIRTLIEVKAAKSRISFAVLAEIYGISERQLYKIRYGIVELGETREGEEICKSLGIEYVGNGNYKKVRK